MARWTTFSDPVSAVGSIYGPRSALFDQAISDIAQIHNCIYSQSQNSAFTGKVVHRAHRLEPAVTHPDTDTISVIYLVTIKKYQILVVKKTSSYAITDLKEFYIYHKHLHSKHSQTRIKMKHVFRNANTENCHG